MNQYFGVDFLIESEIQTQAHTDRILQGNFEHFPIVIDSLFKLVYFTGKQEDPESNRGMFFSYAHATYTQAPYTFWAIYGLYRRGYYYEGLILFRNLVESFIQMRYFEKHIEKCKDFITDQKRINFKQMFDEFTKGYYERYYGLMLSGFSHGKIIKDLFRTERKSITEARSIMGCEYNESHATYLSNYMTALLYGYLNLFELFFPNNTLITSSEVYDAIYDSKRWLELSMKNHRERYPKTADFYDLFDKLIYYK